jgi:TraM recognition site of TraD and TraG
MQLPVEVGTWIIIVPVVLALGVLSMVGARDQRSASSSSSAKPEEPDKRPRPSRLARWRARRGVHHGWSRWTIGFSNPVRATAVELSELRHHTLVCGATGSGKTNVLLLLVDAFAEHLPIVVVDCKASAGLKEHVGALPNAAVWTIGGKLRWDPLRGDATSVANRLMQGEWYSHNADVYRASAERYVLWTLQAFELAGVERTPQRLLEHLDPPALINLLRRVGDTAAAERLISHIKQLGQVEREGIAGFRARFGLILEGVAAPNLGPGLALEDALRARQPMLFSLDAATYPELATKIGAWILLDLVRVAALRPGPSLIIVDEFSALGREGRHVVPLLARSRESGMACVLATQGLADLARVDRDLPQQITQNTAVRLALRQGSAEDQEAWSALLGGAPIPFGGSSYVRYDRARAVSPDELAMLRTGEAFLQIMPGESDGTRQRLWIARPRRVGATSTALEAPETEQGPSRAAAWVWPDHTKRGDLHAIWIDPRQSSALAHDRAGPRDHWRSAALGTADDAPDRTLVLRESEDSDQPDRGVARAGLPEDDRHPVACTCDCHGDSQGSSSASRPAIAAKAARARPTAARPDGSGDRGMVDGAGPGGGLDHGAGAIAGRAQRSTRPGRTAASRAGSSTRRSAGPSGRSSGSSGSGADAETRPDGV